MANLYLIVAIAGERVAVPACDVESVVEVEALTPVPGAAPHILGLTALRSRVLTAIDSRMALGLPARELPHREAIVVSTGGHPYALLVDRVEDVIECAGGIEPAATILEAGWARVARGVIEAGEAVFLLIDPAALIDAAPRQAA